MMYICIYTYYAAPRSYKHNITCISMEKNTSHIDEAKKLHTPSIHPCLEFRPPVIQVPKGHWSTQQSKHQCHSQAETSGPGFFLRLKSATQICGGWFRKSWWFRFKFQPILKICIYSPQKGTLFFEKGNEASKPGRRYFFWKAICSFSGWIGPAFARRNGNWWFVMPKV